MKVGDYVRLKNGYIDKIEELKLQTKYTKYNKLLFEHKAVECLFSDEDLKQLKSSPNIIDLIEIGDYVNGMKITNKYIDKETDNIELEFNNRNSYLYPKSWNYEARSEEYKIKSIVTKEQFERTGIRIGE